MKRSIIILALMTLSMGLRAQQNDASKKGAAKEPSADSLMNSLDSNGKSQNIVSAFHTTRLILSPTTETVKKNNLNFLVVHRFGDFAGSAGGGKTAFGLDAINDVYIGFEYGVSDNVNINFGRSTVGQLIELQLKYAVLHQTTNGSPIAISLLGGTGVRPYQTQLFTTFSDRLSYIAQAIFASRLSSAFSFQVSPIFVRDNTPIPNDIPGNEQQFFSMQAVARIKLSKHMGFIVDYAHPFSTFRQDHGFSDPLGFGIEVETGGHVFTLNVSNARASSEINYLSNTQADFGRGQYRIGFTISRMFDFNHKSTYK